MSGPDETANGRPRWLRPRALLAWALVAAAVLVVLVLGTSAFDAGSTSRFVMPVLRWLLPEWEPIERYRLAMSLRKLAHPIEYALLAILAFRAWRLSLMSGLLRIALLAFALVLGVASVDEFLQAGIASRTGSPWDVVLDACGALLAIALATQLVRRQIATRLLGDAG